MEYDSLGAHHGFERDTAIAVLETRDESALLALKQFLQAVPNPRLIEGILAQAICHCAETSPDTLAWIVAHAPQLEPELHLQPWARRRIASRLLNQGCDAGSDFCFESGNSLRLGPRARSALEQNCSGGELRLIQALFSLNPGG